MLRLAQKAFYPAPPPFPLLHVDTTWKFRDMYAMRERMAAELRMPLIVHQNPEAKAGGINPFDHGSQVHTDLWKTQGLKQALDAARLRRGVRGGAARRREKSRAKERIFSAFARRQHRWDPKSQRPELWHLYNGRKHAGRVDSGVSRSATGPSSTSGSTSGSKTFPSCRCTLRPSDPVVSAAAP